MYFYVFTLCFNFKALQTFNYFDIAKPMENNYYCYNYYYFRL